MLKILCWPFLLIWGLIGFLFSLLGSLLSIVIGAALVLVGGVLTLTIVGSFVGIPLLLLGALLIVRAFF